MSKPNNAGATPAPVAPITPADLERWFFRRDTRPAPAVPTSPQRQQNEHMGEAPAVVRIPRQ